MKLITYQKLLVKADRWSYKLTISTLPYLN